VDPLDFVGRVVVVTGGTRGVGRGIAERFLSAGADVLVCARHEPESLPNADAREALFVAADVREAGDAERVVGETVGHLGRIDVLVNNAGGSPPAAAADASPRFSESIVRLNLLAPLHAARAANVFMQEQETGGVVVNIGSVSGMRPSPGTAAYGAAKAGLLNLTRTLAQEWAPKVRVNAVTPGPVVTEETGLHYGGSEGVAAVGRTIPMGRMATPDDVAAACLFLASPLAAYVTGANLVLDGGGERPAFLGAVDEATEGSR
jgi:NAD(P)-dependent dehydrogenase (short-subunit alcohol dehydrogenase family)